ncbi:MAG: FlgD immunoglobulin-like domain containing protein [Candidatus Krumholzibacteria bacterium]|jgi:hypothetical protein|nr:FlgD immunoglobulin-like domain containing protein [Candidatus Krumholzibacteria bacterium]MDP6669470.1 FlgD immunoglobulin-like domain containing protein [Candidatus Krumholzibacteria bacterium]MDP6797737.1 FlgD immunoglobulin-like domain containing protein [Candidatus Krumholzibacteria bacterium]MDP7021129.1 FlgD immunoglobulin-like domain containing protein [Candidatus Krumholzibacteria bacterium]
MSRFHGLLLLFLIARIALACDPDTPVKAPDNRSSCEILTSSTPFVELNESPVAAAPSWFPTEYNCLDVAKDDEGYLLLFTSSEGFYRLTSPDGIAWSEPDTLPSFPRHTSWFADIKCPDIRFYDNELLLYFKGNIADSSDPIEKGIGRAVSFDRGLNWDILPNPVITQDQGCDSTMIDSPSVIPFGDQFLMSYMVKSQVADFHTCIAFSPDGINWDKHPGNPIISPEPGTWYDRAAGTPRLLADPDGSTLHLFFTGTKIGTLRCARTGHAVSFDQGMTWTVDPLPVLDLNPVDESWNDSSIWCSSFIWEGSRLSTYFVGMSSDTSQVMQFGLAQALWPLDSSVDAPADGGSSGNELPLLITWPNPFAQNTTIRFAAETVLPGGSLDLVVYDISGRRVRSLWTGNSGELPPLFVWDGKNDQGRRLASGQYLLSVTQGDKKIATAWVTSLK